MTPDQPAWMPPSWELRGEINVTPFIDVMLVLLIIFMVTAPMMMSQVPLKLPKTAAQPLPAPHAPVVVSLDGDGRLFLDREALDYPALVSRLAALTRATRSRPSSMPAWPLGWRDSRWVSQSDRVVGDDIERLATEGTEITEESQKHLPGKAPGTRTSAMAG